MTVKYATANGTNTTAGVDYKAESGTATFKPGVTALNVTIPIIGNKTVKSPENFVLNLSSPTGGVLTTTQATCTINASSTKAVTSSTKTVAAAPAASKVAVGVAPVVPASSSLTKNTTAIDAVIATMYGPSIG